MTTAELTCATRRWHFAALILALASTVPAVLLLLSIEVQHLRIAADATGLVVAPVVLTSAVGFYYHWRISGGPASAWLTVWLLTASVVGSVQSALVLRWADHPVGWAGALAPSLCMLLVVIVRASERRDLQADPALVGVAVGVVMTICLTGIGWGLSAFPAPSGVASASALLTVLAGALVASLLARLTTFEHVVRRRLATAFLLIAVAQAAGPNVHDTPAIDVLCIVAGTLGAAWICATALVLLRSTISRTADELTSLHHRLERLEADVRVSREHLHEINSTIAGIASATQVIRQPGTLSVERRTRLEAMVEQELRRLGRLLVAGKREGPQVFCLDEAIEPVVLGQQSRGHAVSWAPSGLLVIARPDDVSEIVNILLENAARHGGSATVDLGHRVVGADVEITVSDTGPGMGPEMADRLFDWGAKSESSPGQGIGLHVARTLAAANAGSLELVSSPAPGATFVVRLPSAITGLEMSDDARTRSA